MLDRDVLNLLHAGVLRDDREAIEAVAEALFAGVLRILRRQWRDVDQGLINDAVEDALLAYFHSPGKFDSSRARLDTLIVAMASKRLLTLLRSDRRRRFAETRASTAQVPATTPVVTARVREAVRAKLSDTEWFFLQARLSGEWRTPELARVIGASNVHIDEQRLIVKRMTERLRLRLRRLGEDLGRQGSTRSRFQR